MLEKLKEIIADQLNVDEADIEPATSFKDDLAADSLDLYEIIMAIEEEYSIEIPSDDLNSIATVEDVMNYLKNLGIDD
ncbi:MAG: acyl carrier protein [Lachnospiraceae bacterium]|jgi:acyl carrier protein|nr:acyl carrier protein [Lachnospiraceae bacterium]MBQ9935521.1 acyl carrier protein [Lachnospiraceae bacterium]